MKRCGIDWILHCIIHNRTSPGPDFIAISSLLKERNSTQPLLLEKYDTIKLFANVEQKTKVDVVVILFGSAMQRRPFSEGEGKEG